MTGVFCGLILYLKEFSGLLLVYCFCQVSFRFSLLYIEYLNVCSDFIWTSLKQIQTIIYFFQEPTWPIVVVMLVPTKNSGSKLKQWLWKISSKFNYFAKIINYFQIKHFPHNLTPKNHFEFCSDYLNRIWRQICFGKSMFWEEIIYTLDKYKSI